MRSLTGRRPVLLFDPYIDRFKQHLTTGYEPLARSRRIMRENRFWGQIRGLCQNTGDPVHCVIAARSDRSHVECFQLVAFHSRDLLNLPQAAAFNLIRTLGWESAVTNPENGFIELSQRLAERLAKRSRGVLAIELRVVLAGLAYPRGQRPQCASLGQRWGSGAEEPVIVGERFRGVGHKRKKTAPGRKAEAGYAAVRDRGLAILRCDRSARPRRFWRTRPSRRPCGTRCSRSRERYVAASPWPPRSRRA